MRIVVGSGACCSRSRRPILRTSPPADPLVAVPGEPDPVAPPRSTETCRGRERRLAAAFAGGRRRKTRHDERPAETGSEQSTSACIPELCATRCSTVILHYWRCKYRSSGRASLCESYRLLLL